MPRYDMQTHLDYAEQVRQDGIAVLRGHFDPARLSAWASAFAPLLAAHLARTPQENRGAHRHYLTLPFDGLFADPAIFADPDILAIVEHLVGPDPVLCQLATDTPLAGSDYQPLHRDTGELFPGAGLQTPPFQLAVNFPLCDVTLENGAFETTRATQHMARDEALARIADGTLALEALPMTLGDVMIRDVRAIHRGTPNRTPRPRPMVVLGYSRAWLLRPEVHIDVPRAVLDGLPGHARALLRHNPVTDTLPSVAPVENYSNFMY